MAHNLWVITAWQLVNCTGIKNLAINKPDKVICVPNRNTHYVNILPYKYAHTHTHTHIHTYTHTHTIPKDLVLLVTGLVLPDGGALHTSSSETEGSGSIGVREGVGRSYNGEREKFLTCEEYMWGAITSNSTGQRTLATYTLQLHTSRMLRTVCITLTLVL